MALGGCHAHSRRSLSTGRALDGEAFSGRVRAGEVVPDLAFSGLAGGDAVAPVVFLLGEGSGRQERRCTSNLSGRKVREQCGQGWSCSLKAFEASAL